LASGDDLVVVRTNDALADQSLSVNVGDSVVVAWRPEDAFELESELV